MRLISKIKSAIRCIQEHGIIYTVKIGIKKVEGKTKKSIISGAKKLGIDKQLKKFNNTLKIRVYEKVKIRTINPDFSCSRTYLFGKLVSHTKTQTIHHGPVFYYKINRLTEYALMCIQNWLTITYYMDGEFYFVCDNELLEREIVRKCCFRDGDIKFMPSRRRELKSIAKNLWTGNWEMATYAHLTPFYHARENNIKEFWAIDGDDTMFFLYPEHMVKVLNQAQNISRENEISAFSLDMHWSQMKGRHWSLGVLFINNTVDFCDIFEKVSDLSWTIPYKEIDDVFNLDWFFNYIRDNKIAKVETFYVENSYFCHWFPNILRYIIGGNVCYWSKMKVIYPIIRDVYKNSTVGEIDIVNSYKIDIGVELEDGLKFLENEVSILHNFSQKARNAFGLGEFGMHSKYYLPM